ncbi:glycosyltransferase family 87 protein [Halovenus salina]|uniref:Glycosyltransferase family 87 protein n=1 Tax=Halovenus salina TaxID=1510225 RepID=A0ABD5W5S1_9EURY|nr:glycosyltransferase family 87 protein [Halovenus salina]
MSLSRELWKRRHEQPLFVALCVLTVAVVVVWPVVDALLARYDVVHVADYGFNDFGAYSGAVDNWLSGDGPIYTRAEDGGFHGSYLYPPYALPLFYPFAKLGFEAGPVLFGVFSLFLLYVGVEAVVEELGYGLTVPERVVLLFGLFGFHPALWDFKWGQVSTLLAAFLCFAFYTHERGQRGHAGSAYLSGLFTALAGGVKLFYATAGAHMLRNSRRFVGGVLTGVGLLASSVVVFGLDTHELYLEVLTWGKGWGTDQLPPAEWQTAYYRPLYLVDQTVDGIGLSLPNQWIPLAIAGGVLGVIGLTLRHRHNPGASVLTFALGVAVIPLFAPRAYTHDLVVLLLPAILLLSGELDRADGLPWIPVLAVLLVHFQTYGTRAAIHLSDSSQAVMLQPGVYGTFLLVGLAAGRLYGLDQSAPSNDTEDGQPETGDAEGDTTEMADSAEEGDE